MTLNSKKRKEPSAEELPEWEIFTENKEPEKKKLKLKTQKHKSGISINKTKRMKRIKKKILFN